MLDVYQNVYQNLKAFLGEMSTNAQRSASYWPCSINHNTNKLFRFLVAHHETILKSTRILNSSFNWRKSLQRLRWFNILVGHN